MAFRLSALPLLEGILSAPRIPPCGPGQSSPAGALTGSGEGARSQGSPGRKKGLPATAKPNTTEEICYEVVQTARWEDEGGAYVNSADHID
jgi:hypothetical protein